MRKLLIFTMLLTVIVIWSCSSDNTKVTEVVIAVNNDKDLGLIEADVKDDAKDLLGAMPTYSQAAPGTSEKMERAFENAPPLIPHTVEGFLPIKMENNICFSCHMPDKVEESGAVEIPKMHFTILRPALYEKNGIYYFAEKDTLVREETNNLNNAFFNCTQCHVPQANIKVDIKNLFTPEFREKFGLEKSTLEKQFEDGL